VINRVPRAEKYKILLWCQFLNLTFYWNT
jgi:hypothetical protein